MPEPLFLGVDAGNSKTLAIVVDAAGAVRGVARGGIGDIYGVADSQIAVDAVLDTVRRALDAADASLETVRSAAFRLAGVDWPEDEALWVGALDGFLAATTTRSVLNDGFACLRCGDPTGVGVAVSLGTGAAVAGRGPGDREFSVSWWLQDYLGAAGLGRDGLRAVALAELGMGAPTSLSRELPGFYGVDDAKSLVHLANSRTSSLGHIDFARAARVVVAASEAGDAVAREVIDQHMARVADYVEACARRVGLDPTAPFAIVLGGSVASEPSGQVRRALLAAIGERMPQASVTMQNVVPILGCALDALAEGGVPLDATLQRRMLDAGLPADLLAT